MCIAGVKGVGKSTLVSLLSDDEHIILGDDTLRVKKNLMAYRAHNLIKITAETASSIAMRYDVTRCTNSVGKYYGILPDLKGSYDVSSFVELSRKEAPLKIRKINGFLIRNSMLRRNIVGVNFFDKQLLKKVHSATLDVEISCFSLEIPNDLSILLKEQSNIKQVFEEVIYE